MIGQGDLFEWLQAKDRETMHPGIDIPRPHKQGGGGVVIDARPRLQAKTVAFFSALVRGYHPPHCDTQIVVLQDKRSSRAA